MQNLVLIELFAILRVFVLLTIFQRSIKHSAANAIISKHVDNTLLFRFTLAIFKIFFQL